MATSGSVSGNNVPDGGEGSYLDWQLASQDIAGNYSVVNWQAGWRFPTYSCRGLRLGAAEINGVNVYLDNDAGDGVHNYNSGHDHRPRLETAAGQIVIGHNADGSKNFGAYVRMTGFSGQFSEGASSWDLPVIPRFSSPPSTPVISSVTSTSFFVTFTDGGGGAPIDGREIRYGTNSSGAGATIISSDGSTSIAGLTKGTTYYVWARTHNVAGYSDWSPRAQATTLREPFAPTTPVISNIKQTVVDVTFSDGANGGSAITSRQIGYGTSTNVASATVISSDGSTTITGLSPGVTYRFWARCNNAIGNGDWSAMATATTIAGARVVDGGVVKKAIPWVKDAGVWKLARPWAKNLGIWKESI